MINSFYRFSSETLMRQALTHSSFANEHGLGKLGSYERLEFLGDAVLDVVISEKIYADYPELDEGELSKLRAGLVCEAMLAKKARLLMLDKRIMMGRGELGSGGNMKDSILCDVYEAVTGAVFLDGGYEAAKLYILSQFEDDIKSQRKTFHMSDSKTYLQEYMQSGGKETVVYNLISTEGPDHDRTFLVEALHQGKRLGIGKGRNKKEAEQNAACDAISKLGNIKNKDD